MNTQQEDKQLLDLLEEMIKKKKEEIAGLNKLIGSIQHPEISAEADSGNKKNNSKPE